MYRCVCVCTFVCLMCCRVNGESKGWNDVEEAVNPAAAVLPFSVWAG